MRPLKLGMTLPTIDLPINDGHNRWAAIERAALTAEEIGFDTVWLPDELLWKFPPDHVPMGTWECVAMAAAIAAVTERVTVGTWVLSALHRNPGLTARVAETIDEISSGRFLFGLGAGHSGSQGKAFGYPPDRVVSRYEEALQIVVQMLREGTASFNGDHHAAFELDNTPRGPRGERLPLMLAGHGPRTISLAVAHGDIWSGYATESSLPGAFTEMLELVDRACEDQGRDPSSLGRSIGVFVEMTDVSMVEESGLGIPLRGSPVQIADTVVEFASMGVTMLEMVPAPFNAESIERLGEVLDLLGAG